ncbi:MAG: MBL fold metallo-hydrolase [Ruminococcaceae bacterium]|nr:MBL fold metallo-hydrolase [Oscillospiraceae bacterium]
MPKVCQLFSGSSGNSIFVSDGRTKLLVDAGVSAKRIEQALSDIGESADELSAVLITHEHSDHIKGLRVLASKHKIPVFAHGRVLASLKQSGDVTDSMQAFETGDNAEFGGVEIVPFENSHDSVACLGYRLNMCGDRSISVCTDTGYITDDAKEKIAGSDLVFLESNHEITMLQNGPYPYNLKLRILSERGHLSNAACSEFAAELMKSGTTRIVLSHLSRDNNHPEIARQTTLAALTGAGFVEEHDFRLRVSAPENDGRAIIL